jgi:hypothetical protein
MPMTYITIPSRVYATLKNTFHDEKQKKNYCTKLYIFFMRWLSRRMSEKSQALHVLFSSIPEEGIKK